MTPKPPVPLAERGRRLWAALLTHDPEMAAPMREVAVEACRVADRLDRLEAICSTVEPMIDTGKGEITHPAFTEARQQAALLARLVATLRLPDSRTGRRPQHRGPRGVHLPAAVTSLERARIRSSGDVS